MTKKKNKEEQFLNKAKGIVKLSLIIAFAILVLIYGIKGGFYSLIFDLKASKQTILYSIFIIVLLCALIFLNISEEDEDGANFEKSSYLTVGVIVLIILFSIILFIKLLDFFLPIAVLLVFMIIMYYAINKLIEVLVKKYGIK